MMRFMDHVRGFQRLVAQAAQSDFARQVRTTLTQDLPALLAEMSALNPAELREMGEGLDQGLTTLIHVCGEEQRTLNGWHAARALTLKLSLDRLAGMAVPLECTLARYALALRRTDPRLGALGFAYAIVAPAMPTEGAATGARPTGTPVSGPLADLSGSDCRAVTDGIRETLRDTVLAARRIQQGLRGAHAHDAEMVAGVIEQMRTLVGWLRQREECYAGMLTRPERVAH